ncbi:MAG: efflux RND transporter permease subunit [Puniceicoccaceae bacterium]
MQNRKKPQNEAGMIAWFARNGVAANLLMLVVAVAGVVSLMTVKRELFPQFSLDMITVSVPYLGASPEEMEEAVIVRIEEAIQGLDGIKQVRSTAVENMGSVVIEVRRGYNLAKVKEQVKTRVDAISTFPEQTERPIVDEVLLNRDTIWVSLYGDTDERALKEMAVRLRDELVEISGISQVEVQGVRDYEISIEVSEHRLRSHGLTFDEVVNAVRGESLDLPGGTLRTRAGEISVRTKEQDYRGVEFERIVLRQHPDGGRLLLEDVATVRDGFVDQPILNRFNGKPCAFVLVQEVGDENPLEISAKVYEYVDEVRERWVPEGIEIVAWGDGSFYLQDRLDLLINNGLIGFVLVFLSLALFLRPSLAVFVSIGIPVSFLGTFAIAPFIGVSINLISLFAFILVLGIVVDDAIVVGESVFSEYQQSEPGVDAAIRGTHRVSTPVTFAVLTTMVAFLPVFFLPGLMGKFFVMIPAVVIPTLAFSLIQSKLVLPYHLTLCRVGDRSGRSHLNVFSRFQRAFSDRLEHFIHNRYAPFAQRMIHFRYLVFAGFVAMLLLSIGLVGAGWVRSVWFPNVPSDFIMVDLEMAPGTNIEQTNATVEIIENTLLEVAKAEQERTGFNPVQHYGTMVGYAVSTGGPSVGTYNSGSHLASIVVEMGKSELRDSSAFQVSTLWRDQIGTLPGVRRLVFHASASGPTGLPIDIRLTGRDFGQLKAASLAIQERLKQYDGIFDIRDTYAEGKQEVKVYARENARALGVTAASLGSQVRSAFYGAEAQRIQRGKHDVRVMVRLPENERQSLGSLQQMRIRTGDGREIPIAEVAELEYGFGYPTISRVDRKRVIQIQADADKDVANLTDINAELYETVLPELLRDYPGVVSVKDGEAKDQAEVIPVLMAGAILVLVAIYALIAVPFKSYLQPLIVILVVPFGVGGAIAGHFLTGQELSVLSFLGIIALTGVVVNDSLVLVDCVNQLIREQGMPMHEAVWRGAVTRFRPILLTSVTTFVGLIPILLERSLQAQFLIPMATSLSFGVLFATFITLMLVPCSYLILEDIQRLLTWMFGRWWRGFKALFGVTRGAA